MTTKRPKSCYPDECQFPFADGRRCRMLRHKDHPSLCAFHARDEQQLLESHRLGDELSATLTGNFLTAADINHVLGKVFAAVAQGRLPQRTAATLAFLGQLMLHSIPTVKDETQFEYSYEAWQKMIGNAIRLTKAALPGLHSPLTPENAASMLAPNGHRATTPPAWHEDRGTSEGRRKDTQGTASASTSADPKNN